MIAAGSQTSTRSAKRSTYDQFRDAIKDLDLSSSESSIWATKPLSNVFLKYWDSNDAAAALSYLKYMEMRTRLKTLQQKHGRWSPPQEVAKYLKKGREVMSFTKVEDSKEERNRKLVLHVLGVTSNDNRPFKDFLRAKTIRQRRYWLYKYMGPLQAPFEIYREAICETRLKRLYHFFPERFKDEDGIIYFNNKTLLYNETSHLFFFGTRPYQEIPDDQDSSFSDDWEISAWKSD